MVAIGFGMALWYGMDWVRLPPWTEAQIEESVELNLQLELAGRTDASRTVEPVDARRDQIRRELQEQLAGERNELARYAGAGLLIGLFGLAAIALQRRFFRDV